MVRSCLLRFGVDVDEYEGPQERASRVARQGETKQKFNLSKFVSIIALRKPSGEKAVLYLGIKSVLPGESLIVPSFQFTLIRVFVLLICRETAVWNASSSEKVSLYGSLMKA